jgi:hypothetical protein
MSDDDRRAARTIANLIRTRDAERTDEETGYTDPCGPDPDTLAAEIITVLRGHGWRPTPATRPPPWQPTPGEPLDSERYQQLADQARAGMEAAITALRELHERLAQTQGTHAATTGGDT